jgi:hypothetical protein
LKPASCEQAALFEHRFWLQILGDHSRFILNSLSPIENGDIQKAREFMEIFDQLLNKAREACPYSKLCELTKYAYEYAKELRCFKLELLSRHLVGKIVISLSPTFIDHMVNELEEYLRILECLLVNQAPPLTHPVHHHLLWVSDAIGHAATLACSVDLVETDLKETGDCFARDFKDLYLKAVEIKGYLRAGVEEFPALTRYNFQVEKEILGFNAFLCKLLNMVGTKQALSILTPLTPDHMLREECYFLTKLAQVSEVKLPECDPTRPRVEC